MTRERKEAILGGCSDCGADGKGNVTLVGHQPAQGDVFFLASARWDPE